VFASLLPLPVFLLVADVFPLLRPRMRSASRFRLVRVLKLVMVRECYGRVSCDLRGQGHRYHFENGLCVSASFSGELLADFVHLYVPDIPLRVIVAPTSLSHIHGYLQPSCFLLRPSCSLSVVLGRSTRRFSEHCRCCMRWTTCWSSSRFSGPTAKCVLFSFCCVRAV